MEKKPRIGLAGFGYWGPNLLRNLVSSGGAEIVGVVDGSADARARASRMYPHIPAFESVERFLATAKPDAVVIATPPSTHRDIAVECLNAGAHVLVEKPLAMSADECDQILAAAKKAGRQVMVDHTFAYNPPVQYLADQLKTGALGDMLFYDSVRVNLGGFQARTNVLWDLAPHDLSILDLLSGGLEPTHVTCVGIKHFEADVENLCYVHLTYANKLVAHLHLNWVAPMKIRTIMVGGTKKMAVYDENLPAEKVKIYDKGLSLQHGSSPVDFRVSYRTGDMVAPAISNKEALANVVAQFIQTVATGAKPVSDGESGRRVVRILEAAAQSMAQGGAPVALEARTGRKLRVA